MRTRKLIKVAVLIVHIVLTPLFVIEMLLKGQMDILSRIRLSFQLMLFVGNLGDRK